MTQTARGTTGLIQKLLPLILSLAVLPRGTQAQGWEHVLDQGGQAGSAIGGGVGNTLDAGFTNGRVFRSDDNGLTWVPVNNGLVDDAGRALLPRRF